MSQNMRAYDEHKAWIASMYAQLAAYEAKRDAPEPSGSPSPRSKRGHASLGMGHTGWSDQGSSSASDGQRAASQFDNQFGSLALSSETLVNLENDERLIYRSLDKFNFSDLAADVVDDAPVYRSLGGMFDRSSTGSWNHLGECSTDTAHAEWLDTMPPLLKRQRGGVLR